MIDLRAARNEPDEWRRRLARKGAAELFDELLEADRAARELQPRVEELRGRRKLKGKPTPDQLAEPNGSATAGVTRRPSTTSPPRDTSSYRAGRWYRPTAISPS